MMRLDELALRRRARQQACADRGHPGWRTNEDGSKSCCRCGLTVQSSVEAEIPW